MCGAVVAGSFLPSAARADDSLIDRAVAALRAELEALEAQSPGTAPSAALQEADLEGRAVMGAMVAAGYRLPPVVMRTLGPLPELNGGAVQRPPSREDYELAIARVQLLPVPPGGDSIVTVPPVSAPAAPPTPATESAGDAAGASGTTLWVVLSFAAIALLGGGFAWHRTRRAQHFADLAMRDDLTGLGNRRRLDRDLAALVSSPGPVSVLMIDVDHFKAYNDRHGHMSGDEALRVVADVLRHETRQRDVVYRYGGEEFCVLLADTPVDSAAHVAERIRVSVAAAQVPGGAGVTVSLGLAVGEPRSVLETVRRADDALFDSKHAGRDRVTVNVGIARAR